MDYYNKYIKYKYKYLKLKTLLGGGISKDDLYILFTKSLIKTKKEDEYINTTATSRKRRVLPKILVTPLPKRSAYVPGPISELIIGNEHTGNREFLLKQFEKDNQDIKTLEKFQDIEDEDEIYKEYENYGKTVECWVADNMPCPVCNQLTLRRYSKDNFPVIDLLCSNKSHRNGVKFFQVKSSNGTPFNGSPYFDKNTKTIRVGSKRYGSLVHDIKSNDDKKLLIGYICISYDEREYDLVSNDKSFIVLPNLNDTNNTPYYCYILSGAHPIIQFNDNCTILNIKKYRIPKNYYQPDKWEDSENPLYLDDSSIPLNFIEE